MASIDYILMRQGEGHSDKLYFNGIFNPLCMSEVATPDIPCCSCLFITLGFGISHTLALATL